MTERPDIRAEFAESELGDRRLVPRLELIAESVAKRPGTSLPSACGSISDLEGTYRFLRNERVTPAAILAPHQSRVAARAKLAIGSRLVAIYDTTEFAFSGEFTREGLGLLVNGGQGFLGHFGLLAAVHEGDCRDPIGVAHVETLFRTERKPKRRSGHAVSKEGNSEGLRWDRGMRAVDDLVGDPKLVVHVADREADCYRVIAGLWQRQARFVLRSQYNRRTQLENGDFAALHDEVREERTVALTRTITINARHPGELKDATGKRPVKSASQARTPANKKAHPPRSERLAELKVTVSSHVVLKPRVEQADLPKQLSVTVVRVFEPNPPEGAAPVEWILLTNEPAETKAEVEAIIDTYRARWLIEEFFKSLKTGCGYEKLQLEKKRSLVNALAIYAVIAWQMLRTRTLGRMDAERPATDVLSESQIAALRVEHADRAARRGRKELPENLTAGQAMWAIAALGGHIKNNGPPGWLTLGRGFHEILACERGYLAAKREQM